MYRCEHCTSLIGPRQSQYRVVSESRKRTYVSPKGAVSEGWEIVRELKLCEPCHDTHETKRALLAK